MSSNLTISNLIKENLAKFKFSDIATTRFDVQAIVCEVLGVDKTYLYMYPDKILNVQQIQDIEQKVLRLSQGEPLAYILGYKYFWKQKLFVTKDTLIPRADTEVLVQAVLKDIDKIIIADANQEFFNYKSYAKLKILDLGTGAGAIALALASELPNSQIIAVDLSEKVLEVAQRNAIVNNINNVNFIKSNWYQALGPERFDIIVSNPPYIDHDDSSIDSEVKRYEPKSALFAGDKGLADIKTIVNQASKFLMSGGRIYLEHGFTQSKAVVRLLQENNFSDTKTIKDLNSKDRCTVGQNL
ncbi:peptide chain release factor N(5)-glutamine methyltransferase [Allofrancisella guangzhouensis]|uniref:Release factor glutamine methyltransferase n=1 Tax=Allofrancisella guangzhouensis TaxID=594679 RepID=A0A0A8E1X3_9GAMM|nr:peptide chain release factor N(5)-glutamine methyltransferase [Allofrancisella guangzhouensis]AJC48210.1 SAM-dependent methyltransferase [Allofrancisella guangzhouensis]MBK2027171.1 peptide chain release factor N(5)-glutamine methyltransferase [Allofrancisella guangzhouensis]MBK2044595.1 peptide chain release factor N(5)-glutamine methyltransferase [Allofrancisella guangzhouensis]MBK2045987.1 peptide chain release factor N(5)-glutamine methyltransferase [Allofrancisella guangzhouensis]